MNTAEQMLQLKKSVADMQACGFTLQEATAILRRLFIERALERHNFNQVKAARALGVHRNTIHRLILEHGIRCQRLPQGNRPKRPPQTVRTIAQQQIPATAEGA
jgi:transcriptional regulator with GAF, ATPase, and Fis domain